MSFSSATKPVYKLEDLKGMTLRVSALLPGSSLHWPQHRGPFPRRKAYEAMQKNVIDGLMIPMETMRAFRYAEVAKHVTECWAIGQVYTFYLVMNKNVWNKLPADIQKIFNEYPFEEKFATMWNEIDIDGKKYGEEKGLQFIELQSEEISKWKKAVEPVLEDYVKKMVASGFNEKETRELIKYAQSELSNWTKKPEGIGESNPSTGPCRSSS